MTSGDIVHLFSYGAVEVENFPTTTPFGTPMAVHHLRSAQNHEHAERIEMGDRYMRSVYGRGR